MKKKSYKKPAVEVHELQMRVPLLDSTGIPQAKQSAVYMSEDVDEKP